VIAEGFIENLVNKGVPKNKIICIPNWVNTNFIRPLPKNNNSWKTTHKLDDKFVILYSGNIALTQRLETLIEAASKLSHLPEIAFVIAGESKALGKLQQYCQVHKANNVLLLPLQPREQLPEMLAAADVGVILQKSNVISFNMPSKIPLLLASGRPIIASVPSNGTAARAIKKSGGGVVIEPESSNALASAIVNLYTNPAKAKKLGEQGRKFAVERYSLEQALQQYEELFADVIATQTSTLPVEKLIKQ
jgi:colanic acid biosynthesis glycosyl transferase WcaI